MPDQGGTQGLDGDPPILVRVWSDIGDVIGNQLHLGLRLLQTDSGLQPSQHLHVVHTALLRRALHGEQSPDVRLPQNRKPRGHDAHDNRWFAIHIDGGPDNVWV